MRWAFLLLFAIPGFALLMGGASWVAKRSQFTADAAVVQGTVVGEEERERSPSDDDDASARVGFYPVVAFESPTGEPLRLVGDVGSTTSSYAVGDRVEVLVDWRHPEDARLNSFVQLWLAPLLTTALGLIFFVLGVAVTIGLRSSPDAPRGWQGGGLDTPFFKSASDVDPGRFRRVGATLRAAEFSTGRDGEPTCSLRFEAVDPVTQQPLTFAMPPTTYRHDGRRLERRDTTAWIGQAVPVTYDPGNPAAFSPDHHRLHAILFGTRPGHDPEGR